jgi:hypothetical protein
VSFTGTQVTPQHGWHIDLVHYVHKGGPDGTLPNHRPLSLVEVFRKVVASVICDRMKQHFVKLGVLDFKRDARWQAPFLLLRSAAGHCKATATELSALLGDLKWCVDTPAQTVIEMALMRLGVPAFYASMLSDIDVHCARSTVTAHDTTVGIAEMVHRQLHGSGQGTVEGPIFRFLLLT